MVTWPRIMMPALIVWLGFSTALRRPARAENSPESLIQQGIELRRKGDDAKAHGYFKRAYELSHTPRAAAQLGLVEQAIGFFIDAKTHLTEALAQDDAWILEHRNVLETSRATVRSHLGQLVTRGLPPGATVQVGDHPAVAVAASGIVWLGPGPATLVFTAPRHAPATKSVTAAA